MKKLHLLLVLLALAPFMSLSQIVGGYHILPIPRSGFLGLPLKNLNISKGIIEPVPFDSASKKLTFEEFAGPEKSEIYAKKFSNLTLIAFKKKKLRVVNVEIDSLKIRTIAPENLANGNVVPGVFAYEGLVADKIRVTCRTSVNQLLDPSEVVKALDIRGGTSKVVSELVKRITIAGNDSLDNVFIIKNPEVIFAARFIKYEAEIPKSVKDFELLHLKFHGSPVNNLSLTPDRRSRGKSISPRYRGDKKDYSHRYFFKVIGKENDLRLIFAVDDKESSYRIVREIPYNDVNGTRVFSLGYETVDRYMDNKGNRRFIRIAVEAKQTSPNTVQIENYEGNREQNIPVTYMKYPYFKFDYINKM